MGPAALRLDSRDELVFSVIRRNHSVSYDAVELIVFLKIIYHFL